MSNVAKLSVTAAVATVAGVGSFCSPSSSPSATAQQSGSRQTVTETAFGSRSGCRRLGKIQQHPDRQVPGGLSRSTSPTGGRKEQRGSSIGRASPTATTPIRVPVSWAGRFADRPPLSRPQLRQRLDQAGQGALGRDPGRAPSEVVWLKVRKQIGCDLGFFYKWRRHARR